MVPAITLRRLLARRAALRSGDGCGPDAAAVLIVVCRDHAAVEHRSRWRYSILPVAGGDEPLATGAAHTENAAVANAHARAQGMRSVRVVEVRRQDIEDTMIGGNDGRS